MVAEKEAERYGAENVVVADGKGCVAGGWTLPKTFGGVIKEGEVTTLSP